MSEQQVCGKDSKEMAEILGGSVKHCVGLVGYSGPVCICADWLTHHSQDSDPGIRNKAS